MKLIERYVSAVSERLPEDIQSDVAEELRSNIEDMLPENPTEDDIREVLMKLGNPRKLAQEYNPVKRYLIGPSLYDSYITVLKMVIGIAAVVITALSLLDWIVSLPDNTNYVESFVEVLSDAVSGCFQAAFWVTLAFAVTERSGINEGELPFAKKKWTPDDLPAAPASPKGRIPRSETVFSILFTVLFTVLICFRPELLAMYIREGGTTEAIPLFNTERLHFYIAVIFVLALAQLGIIVWKFVQARWTVPLAVVNAVQNTAASLLVILMFNDRRIINQDFLSKLGELVNLPAARVNEIWYLGTAAITIVIFAGICLWDSISAFLKCRK
jgi:hypothetical protein